MDYVGKIYFLFGYLSHHVWAEKYVKVTHIEHDEDGFLLRLKVGDLELEFDWENIDEGLGCGTIYFNGKLWMSNAGIEFGDEDVPLDPAEFYNVMYNSLVSMGVVPENAIQ